MAAACLLAALGVSFGVAAAQSSRSGSGPLETVKALPVGGGAEPASGIRASSAVTTVLYFPMVGKALAPCPTSGASYGTVAVLSAPADPPAQVNPDINLAMRGYTLTTGTLGLISSSNPVDPNAPQLYRLFADNRVPVFNAVYQVYDWDWDCNCLGQPIADPPVTLAAFGVTAGEPICAPGSGYDIGRQAVGYSMMVLYASASRITLKYTREDNVVYGYTLHVENLNVDPNLLALYQSMDSGGRSRLPALYAGQPIGSARGSNMRVAIRDTGSFMDPRARNDWWQGK